MIRASLFLLLAILTQGTVALRLGAAEPSVPSAAGEEDPFCTVRGEALSFMSPGTRKMAGVLERLAREADPKSNIFLNGERAELLRSRLTGATNATELQRVQGQVAMELLSAGKTEQSIQEFARLSELQKENPGAMGSRFYSEARLYLALAWLRLGEQENCVSNHTSASCILPIAPEGVHKLQRGSRKAVELIEEQLAAPGAPPNLKAVWLLNIAYMTLGEYPDKVPQAWRIPPEVFKSDHDIKRFPDVAGELGLDHTGLAGGSIAEDFDGDGYLDIMTSDSGLRGPMHYYHNNGDGTFSDWTMSAGLSGLVGGLNIVQGDYNNDGRPDVLVLRGGWLNEGGNHPDSLLRNDGNNHFTDVTHEAGLVSLDPNQTAVWFDFNGDGWLDLFFGYESQGRNVHPCKLFRNNRDGTFTESAGPAGLAVIGFVKGVATGDFNNDGRPDLYLSRQGQPNMLLRNDGPRAPGGAWNTDWKFTEIGAQAGVTAPLASFPTWFFDYDNDGWEDLFVSGYFIKDVGDVAADYLGLPSAGERLRLYHNNRDGTFTDVTKAAKLDHVVLTMASNYGDFDNDGWLDMYLGTGNPDFATLVPDRAFRNAGGAFFQDVTTSGGFGHLQKGHGVSFADLDNDGDQDIYHVVGGAFQGDLYRSVLYENPGHGNHWITLKVEGVQSNRVGIGARLKVVTKEKGAERSIHRTVSTGGSFGANPLRQEIGLGAAESIERVEIFWPVTGRTQVVRGLERDRFYSIREGEEKARPLEIKSFKFSKGGLAVRPHAHAVSR